MGVTLAKARIIPARAGFTPSRNGRSGPIYGSSPLARGLRPAGGPATPLRRIIPARAGFTLGAVRSGLVNRDHPRSRGVYVETDPFHYLVTGSSPLARGLPAHRDARVVHGRIIPARAGFTETMGRSVTLRMDHPRSRGVYKKPWRSVGSSVGSSPLARGLRHAEVHDRRVERIIPARAGFTSKCGAPAPQSADHPRSRGVYGGGGGGHRCVPGSSPLARGLHGVECG